MKVMPDDLGKYSLQQIFIFYLAHLGDRDINRKIPIKVVSPCYLGMVAHGKVVRVNPA